VPSRGELKSAALSPPLPPGGGKDHERPFAIPSFHQKCRPGELPPPAPSLVGALNIFNTAKNVRANSVFQSKRRVAQKS